MRLPVEVALCLPPHPSQSPGRGSPSQITQPDGETSRIVIVDRKKCIVAIAVACSASYRRSILTSIDVFQLCRDHLTLRLPTSSQPNQGRIICIIGPEAQQSSSIDSLPIADFVSGWWLRTEWWGGQKTRDRGLWRSVISGTMDVREVRRSRWPSARTVSRAMTLPSDSSEDFLARAGRLAVFERRWVDLRRHYQIKGGRATGLNSGVLVWSLP